MVSDCNDWNSILCLAPSESESSYMVTVYTCGIDSFAQSRMGGLCKDIAWQTTERSFRFYQPG